MCQGLAVLNKKKQYRQIKAVVCSIIPCVMPTAINHYHCCLLFNFHEDAEAEDMHRCVEVHVRDLYVLTGTG